MPAPAVGGRRGGFQPRDEVASTLATAHCRFVMSYFAPSNEHATMLLQGRGKSRVYPAELPASSGPIILQGGGVRNNTAVYSEDSRTAGDVASYSYSYGKGSRKNDVTVPPMSAEAAGLFSADAYAGIGNVSDIVSSSQQGHTVRQQDEQKNRGRNDLFPLDWPELGSFDDFEADLRKLGSAFEHYFDDPMWPSICSPDVQLVPSSHFDSDSISSAVASKSATNPILEPTLSVPDTADQIEMTNLISMQQLSRSRGRETPSAKKAATPDMILDEMAGNPLEMYFPPLTTYEHPDQVQMSGGSSTQLLPGGFAGEGALNSSGLEFGPTGRASGGGLRENPRSSLISEASPVKRIGFQKLQEGMNQLDVGTKRCIRDALYRLANSVEQRHCVVDQTVGSSSSGAANSLKKFNIVWTETQGSPMDRSVVQLLLRKPLQTVSPDNL